MSAMSTLKRTAAVVGVGAFALGLSLLGATAAHAEGSYQVVDECGFLNDQVIVTGDYTVGYGGHYQDGYNVKDSWGVAAPNPDYSVPDNPIEKIQIATGTFDLTPCPPPPPAPEPSETPQEVVTPPAGQTTTQSPSKTTTQTETVTAPEVTEEPAPEETTEAPEVTVEATEEPEVQATTSTTTEQGVPVGIVVGGLGALAAVGGGAFYAGKRGWFGS